MTNLPITIVLIVTILLVWYITSTAKPNEHMYMPGKIIFEKTFRNKKLGQYTLADARADWPGISPYFKNNMKIVKDTQINKNVLSLTMPANKFGGKYGGVFKVNIPPAEEAYLSYFLKFKKGFDWSKGGKLHGLCGVSTLCKPSENCTPNTGNRKPTGTDGWSARNMWHKDGTLTQYIYHPDQVKNFADSYYWLDNDNQRLQLQTEKWYNVVTRVVLNTPGKHDGFVEGWLDGKKIFAKTGLRFRDIPEIPINRICFSVFFGGSTQDWAPHNDSTIYFDNFKVMKVS